MILKNLFFILKILADKGIIVKDSDGSQNLEIIRGNGGMIDWKPGLNLRLTADGHDFIEALQNDTVWRKIEKELKKPSITTLMNTAQFAFQEYLKSNVF